MSGATAARSFKQRISKQTLEQRISKMELLMDRVFEEVGQQEVNQIKRIEDLEKIVLERSLTVTQSEIYLGMGATMIRRHCRNGKIPGMKIDGKWMMSMEALLIFNRKRLNRPNLTLTTMYRLAQKGQLTKLSTIL